MKALLNKYKKILIYGLISVFVLLVDTGLTYVLKMLIPLVVANTVGVITGGVIQYFLSTKAVFGVNQAKGRNMVIYITTFVFGLLLADGIIHVCDSALTALRGSVGGNGSLLAFFTNETVSFLISKGMSVVLPFFVLYFLRKYLYNKFNKAGGEEK